MLCYEENWFVLRFFRLIAHICLVILGYFILFLFPYFIWTFLFFTPWAMLFIIHSQKQYQKEPSSHGTSNFIDHNLLPKQSKNVDIDHIMLGNIKQKIFTMPLRSHLLTIAPSRSGKGVSSIIPNLLKWRQHLICFDPKGENFHVSYKHRKTFSDIYVFDPFKITPIQNYFNPLDLIKKTSSNVLDDAALLVDMMISLDSSTGDNHWIEESRNLLQGLLLWIRKSEQSHLGELRKLLTLEKKELKSLLIQMSLEKNKLYGRMAQRFLQKEPKERQYILSSCQQYTNFLDSPLIHNSINKSDFNLNIFQQKPLTIYIILPLERIDTYRSWTRLMVGTLLSYLIKSSYNNRFQTLFMIDEFPQLGYMRMLEKGMGILAGYKTHLWLFMQDLPQLRNVYRNWETFLSNSQIIQTFANHDQMTCDYLSKMLGKQTITYNNPPTNLMESTPSYLLARDLLKPEEVRTLDYDQQILFPQQSWPIRCKKLNYLNNFEFKGLYEQNPFYKKS